MAADVPVAARLRHAAGSPDPNLAEDREGREVQGGVKIAVNDSDKAMR